MASSAEQLRDGPAAPNTVEGPARRLCLDLDICDGCETPTCHAECSYYHHPGNNGVLSISELATYALVCRRCEEPHCVNACPKDALEQQPDKDKVLVRHSMRCVACRSCSHACPYGTLYPELVPFIAHNCDYCLDRLGDEMEPLCVKTCRHNALRLNGDGAGENEFAVGANLWVHSTHWTREKA